MNNKTTYLDEQQWQKLQELMDKPPKASEALKELMNEKHNVDSGFMKFKVTIKEDKHIETELPEECFFSDTDGMPYRYEHVKWNGELFYRRAIINTCSGYDFEFYRMTPQEFNDYYNAMINDGYMFSCDKKEFNKALDNARNFVNNQF